MFIYDYIKSCEITDYDTNKIIICNKINQINFMCNIFYDI